MTRHPFFVFSIVLSLAAGVAQSAPLNWPAGPDGARTVIAASPCDSVSPNPFVGEMVILGVSVEGGGNTASVQANDSFTVAIDYHIQVCAAPASNNFCQVVVGYASSAQPLFCVFRERVDCTGKNGTLTFRMKAPAFPTEYLLAFDLQRTLTEPPCPAGWPLGPPSGDRLFACVNVTSGNLPVPVTGGVDNVTASSATFHGTVNPAGAATTARFVFGTAPGLYTDSVDAAEGPVSGTADLAVSGSTTGLSGNTRYYYRATAESEHGYNVGGELSLYTGPLFLTEEAVHSFGHLAPNAVKTDTVVVLNGGNLPMQVNSVIPLSGQYSASPGSAVIGPGGSRKFAVTFSPPAYGWYNSGIVFLHSGASTPDTLAVQGDVPISGVLPGWNIVSVPLTVADPRKTVVFPGAVSSAYEYSAGYVARDSVKNGTGYWLKYSGGDSLVVAGDVRENESVGVIPGWNMIGGPSLEVPLDSIGSTPTGIVEGSFFEYAAGYFAVSQLRPGKGYWVKVDQAGTLTLKGRQEGAEPSRAAGSRLDRLGLIESYPGAPLVVTDAAGRSAILLVSGEDQPGRGGADIDLPPLPPEGAFDVRFDGDRFAARVAVGSPTPILIRGARYPVTIAWPSAVTGGALFVDGAIASLDAPGSVELASARTLALVAAPAGEAEAPRPGRYGLAGNYPNPFNPSTAIRFGVGTAGVVRLAVYNALGAEVAVLADAPYPAGTHTVLFDAGAHPGGVYFCRLFSADGVSTIRMLLVK